MATTKRSKTEVVQAEDSARKGEATGKFAVFSSYWGLALEPTVVIAQLGKLLDDCESTYDFTPLLAFKESSGTLVFNVCDLQPPHEPVDGLDPIMHGLVLFETCPDAYVYANGLLSEGNRWQAAS